MKSLLNRIHARVGDLWWYSAMLFIACRSGDVIQAFIGLWLVPKYVGPDELGAVLPLQQLAGFFTVPLAIVAVVFSKYVNTYATRGERGKVKSFIHDVILVSAALFLVCIVAAYFLIPHFYSRLNIAAGSLTVLVLASGFVGNISNLFGSALQGLKKFKTMTVQSLIGAPIRLVTLLVAMPFRPLSGYLLGQTTPPAATSVLAALSIRKDLKSEIPDTSWRKDLPEIWRYLWPIAIYTIFSTLFATITTTIYRQRLPEIESSAYYILSRFSDVAGLICASLNTVLIPMASEAHERGEDDIKALKHTLIWTAATTIGFFFLSAACAKPIFSLTKIWSSYANYAHLLPWMIALSGIASATLTIVSYEMACRRFFAAFMLIIYTALFTCFLVFSTGYEYFRGKVPDDLLNLIASLHVAHLQTLTLITLFSGLGFLLIIIYLTLLKRRNKHCHTQHPK